MLYEERVLKVLLVRCREKKKQPGIIFRVVFIIDFASKAKRYYMIKWSLIDLCS